MRIENPLARAFYEIEAARESWSTRELERQIGSLLFERLATRGAWLTALRADGTPCREAGRMLEASAAKLLPRRTRFELKETFAQSLHALLV